MKRAITAGFLILFVLIAFSGCDIIASVLGIDLGGGDSAGSGEFIIQVSYTGPDGVSPSTPLIVAVVNINSTSQSNFAYRTVTTPNATVNISESEIMVPSPSGGYAVAVLHDMNNNFASTQAPEPGEPIGFYEVGQPGNMVYTDDPSGYTTVYAGSSISLQFNPPAPVGDSFEPDDSATSANPISINTSENHSLVPNDQDWHYFNAIGGISYTVETFSTGGNEADTVLEVYRANATTSLGSNDDTGGGFFSSVTFTAPADEPVYFKVRGYMDSENGDYGVGVYSNGVSSSYSLAVDTVYPGTISSSGQYDWFSISLLYGQTYRIETVSAGTGNELDTVMIVLNDSGMQVGSNDDKAVGDYYSAVDLTPSYSGTFYVRIRGFSGDTGDYDFSYRIPALLDVTVQ